MRLNTYVAQKLNISGRRARDGIERGGVRVNGALKQFASYKVEPSDVVDIDKTCFEKRSYDITTLYEDEMILAIDKPAGLLTEPLEGTYLVHRLDKETSGVLLLAKTKEAKAALEGLFYKRKIKKEYLALVEGIVGKESGKIESYIEKKRERVFGSGKRGDLATTFWECLERYETTSLLKVMPRTGRTHQIRVHLSEMGHPVIGDMTYGNVGAPNMMLHAHRLTFPHPGTHEELTITAPCFWL